MTRTLKDLLEKGFTAESFESTELYAAISNYRHTQDSDEGYDPLGKAYVQLQRAIADRANAILREAAGEMVRVYFTRWSNGAIGGICTVRQSDSTETAYLVGIEELKK